LVNKEFIAKNSFGANTRTVCLATQDINTGSFTNLQFEPKLKNFVREEIEKEFKRILDSRGIL
jgi:hypothetical protein